jgi:uncharacterized membrane protein YdjX (TVP38/TMEM64 family)
VVGWHNLEALPVKRFVVVAGILIFLVLIPFAIWGEAFETWFSGEAAIEKARGWGVWAPLFLVGLLVADIFLPIPGTVVMSVCGYLYGPWWGGVLAAFGSWASGGIGYGLCRFAGRPLAERIAGSDALRDVETRFGTAGPLLVAISRCLPVLAETACCLAGLARMPLGVFGSALTLGAVPVGFLFAWIGAAGREDATVALALSAAIPAVLFSVSHVVRRRIKKTTS